METEKRKDVKRWITARWSQKRSIIFQRDQWKSFRGSWTQIPILAARKARYTKLDQPIIRALRLPSPNRQSSGIENRGPLHYDGPAFDA